MTGKAPGVGRGFAGEAFAQLPPAIWKEAREQAMSAAAPAPDYEVWASDIDNEMLKLSDANARRAGVLKNIKIFMADARKIEKPDRRGTIVCNPPYGERMLEISEAERLYREIGKNFSRFGMWQIYILSASENFERLYGRRADKIRKLYNGMIPCNLYQFFKPEGGFREDTKNSKNGINDNKKS
jgi:putative N6-adenine-specific DNA methylase